jgi:hypothetical protein
MIQITVSENTPLTRTEYDSFGEKTETPLSIGDKVTLYLKAPIDIDKGVDLRWKTQLFIWKGDHTEGSTSPNIELKEVKESYTSNIFNTDGTPKYPFENSTKDYIFADIENQNRFLVEYLVKEGLFSRESLEITGI